jgi:hypothetical protein
VLVKISSLQVAAFSINVTVDENDYFDGVALPFKNIHSDVITQPNTDFLTSHL